MDTNPFGTNRCMSHTFHELFITTIGGEDKLNDLSNLPIHPTIRGEQTSKTEIEPKDCTFLFELCTEENKVLLDYGKPTVFLLDIRAKRDTPDGYSYAENRFDIADYLINKCSWNIKTPIVFAHTLSISKLIDKINNSPTLIEGVVCYDVYSGVRVKIKTNKYIELAYMTNYVDKLSIKKIIQLIESGGDVEEVGAYLSEKTNMYTRVKIGIDDACRFIQVCYRELEKRTEERGLNSKAQYHYVQSMDIPNCFKGVILHSRKYGVLEAWKRQPITKKVEMVNRMREANEQGSSILG